MKELLRRVYHASSTTHLLLGPARKVYDLYRCRLLPEKTYIRRRFKERMGRTPDLDNPKTLNEKIQWLKLYDRTPLHTQCADKYAVREYLAEKVGEQYLVPLLYHTANPADICPENLPEPPFVIKTNHAGSGGMTFVRDKSAVDWPMVRRTLAKQMKENYYYARKEWQYKNIRPRIIVERMLRTEDGGIPFDYKMHCFNGKVVFIQVDIDRHTRHRRNLYDPEWNPIACQLLYANGDRVDKPRMLGRMKMLAETIAREFIYVRVDFYSVGSKIYIGEITFHPGSGCEAFTPDVWDRRFGDMLKVPCDSTWGHGVASQAGNGWT